MDVHRFPWSAGYAHLDPIGDIYPFFLFLIVNGEDVHNMSTTFPYSSVKSSKKMYIYI